MPQERYNTDWIEENNVGLVLESFAAIRDGVSALTARMPEYRRGVARIDNRAVFEIPEILERILHANRAQDSTPVRVSVDFAQHFRSAQSLHLS
jgi:1,2-diacylglycerol 3-beta-galactosyltransferase